MEYTLGFLPMTSFVAFHIESKSFDVVSSSGPDDAFLLVTLVTGAGDGEAFLAFDLEDAVPGFEEEAPDFVSEACFSCF